MEARKVELLEKRPGYDTTWKISTDMGIFRMRRHPSVMFQKHINTTSTGLMRKASQGVQRQIHSAQITSPSATF